MKKIFTLFLLTALTAGCGSSYLKNSTVVNPEKKSYDKILVIARSKDNTARISFENQVVADLAAQGIKAETSALVIKQSMFGQELTESQIETLRKNIISNGYDGVLVTNLVNTNQYRNVTPGGVSTTYVPVRYGRFGRYYRAYPVSYWEPDRVEEGVEYTLETCLYAVTQSKGDNLQWIGRFQVRNPSDLTNTIANYSKELTEELIAKSIQN